MGAARHGGYRDGQLRRHVDSDFEALPSRENAYARGDYGDADYGRGGGRRAREHDHRRDRDVVRQKDVRDREVMNGGYRSTSSRSDSGGGGGGGGSGGGGARKNGYPVRALDREPGELSSESGGSDGVADSRSRGKDASELKKAENGKHGSELKKAENGENGKRKFSPIIWDRDGKKEGRIVKARVSGEEPTLTVLPRVTDPSSILVEAKPDGHESVLSNQDDVAVISEPSAEMVDVDMQPCEEDIAAPSPAELSPLEPVSRTVEEKVVTVDVYSSTYTIKASRWANEAESSGDEGEIYEETARVKEKRGSESAETRQQQQRKSATPELGELRREGSEENRSRHSEERDSSDADEDHPYDGSSGSRSDSEPVEEHAIPPPRTVNMLQACRSVEKAYEKLNRIDEGTYGVVFRARDKETQEVVALKKVKMEKEREGFPLTALREMNILLSFSHPSIVDVKEVVVGTNLDSIYMVMEYMEHDLKALMESMKQPFSPSEVKCLMLQLLEGVSYLHDNWVLHRDLKTSNILLNNRGELKICDFGLARQYGFPLKPYTPLVVTLWYRAPELLLGAKEYSTAIDMWSLGCIMAELLAKKPLFNGQNEINQLDKIFTILGAPTEKIWPGFSKLPGPKVKMVKYQQFSNLRSKFQPATPFSFTGAPSAPALSDAGFDLLSRLLTYDPAKRITAKEALDHDWFREVPLPKSKEFMPTFPAQHNQDRRTRRVMKSPDPIEEQRRKELQQGAGGLFG